MCPSALAPQAGVSRETPGDAAVLPTSGAPTSPAALGLLVLEVLMSDPLHVDQSSWVEQDRLTMGDGISTQTG